MKLALGAEFLTNQILEYTTLSFRAYDNPHRSINWHLTELHTMYVATGRITTNPTSVGVAADFGPLAPECRRRHGLDDVIDFSLRHADHRVPVRDANRADLAT